MSLHAMRAHTAAVRGCGTVAACNRGVNQSSSSAIALRADLPLVRFQKHQTRREREKPAKQEPGAT